MDVQTWSAVADVIAATAVVASLCFLAVEIRFYLRQVRQESLDIIVSRRFDMLRPLATDGELASIIWRGFASRPRLPPHEWARFSVYLYAVVLEYERTWVKVNSGAIDPQVLETWNSGFTWWLRQPGVRAWWRSDHPGFTPAFAAFVDGQVLNTAEDGAVAQVVAASFRGEWVAPPPPPTIPPAAPASPPPLSPASGAS